MYGTSADRHWHRHFCIGDPMSCSVTATWSGGCGCRRLLNENGSSWLYSRGHSHGSTRALLFGEWLEMVRRVVCWLLSHVIVNEAMSCTPRNAFRPHYVTPWCPPLLPTFNPFSVPPCRRTTTKPRTNFSTTLLPLSYNPATHPTPSALSSKT